MYSLDTDLFVCNADRFQLLQQDQVQRRLYSHKDNKTLLQGLAGLEQILYFFKAYELFVVAIVGQLDGVKSFETVQRIGCGFMAMGKVPISRDQNPGFGFIRKSGDYAINFIDVEARLSTDKQQRFETSPRKEPPEPPYFPLRQLLLALTGNATMATAKITPIPYQDR